MSFIYKITNLNNLKYYYGKTSRTIEERFEEHKKCALKRSYVNSHLYRAMNKEGFESFTIELVEECSDDVVDERERY